MEKVSWVSDNRVKVSPEVMEALGRADEGIAEAYGHDGWTKRLNEVFGEVFEKEVEVIPVPTSSAGNGLALSLCVSPYGSVVGEYKSHIFSDEAGAPEFYGGGCRLLPIMGKGGKLAREDVEGSCIEHWLSDYNHTKPQVLSLGQLTDCGTGYGVDEIKDLSSYCREKGLRVHVDGTRFANALAGMGVSPSELTWKAGVDVMTFGVTKNGGLMCDAVIIFSEDLRDEPWRRLKRAGGLFSKMRYGSSQLLGYVEGGKWLERASHANECAKRVGDAMKRHGDCELLYPVEGNMIFVKLGGEAVKSLERGGVVLREMSKSDTRGEGFEGVYRFVLSWNTKEEEVLRVLGCLD